MRIARHLNGPPDAGHGGYVAGSLATRLTGPGADVWLRAPAPLETDLREVHGAGHVEIWDEQRLIAEADAVEAMADPVPFVGLEAAMAAGEGFPGALPNPYETCFGCGRLRPDGLGIGPGPGAEGLVACVWHPRGRIAPEWIWTALDCAERLVLAHRRPAAGHRPVDRRHPARRATGPRRPVRGRRGAARSERAQVHLRRSAVHPRWPAGGPRCAGAGSGSATERSGAAPGWPNEQS